MKFPIVLHLELNRTMTIHFMEITSGMYFSICFYSQSHFPIFNVFQRRRNGWKLEGVGGGALCFEMGFYVDISWESGCNFEMVFWTHIYKILLVS